MKELAAAISTFFNVTNSLKTALSGQLYPHEASQSATFPYGIYYIIDENDDYTFTEEEQEIDIQFSLFSEKSSPGEALSLGDYMKALFDNAKMSVSGFELIQFKRTGGRLDRDEEMNTWTYIGEYKALLERGR